MRWKLIILFLLFLFIGSNRTTSKSYADTSTSVTVPPQASNFQFTLHGDTATDVPQGTIINYTITYGAYSSADITTDTTIQVSFAHDTDINGTHVLDYVSGSASNGFNNVSPIIDLTNRTITWTIPNFPSGNINQILTFQLETNSNVTSSTSIPFSINATMSNQYVNLPEQRVDGSYLFSQSLVPTPTPIPQPTNTPTPQPKKSSSISPTPITQQQPTPSIVVIHPVLTLESVDITNVTDNSVQLLIISNNPSHVSLSYALTSQNLSNTIKSPTFYTVTPITFDHLRPQTAYFFRVKITDQWGQSVISDLYIVTTAESSIPPVITQTSFALLSQGTILLTTSHQPQQHLISIVLPVKLAFTIALSLPSNLQTTYFQAVIRPKTLSVNPQLKHEEKTIMVSLREQSPNQYVANFITPSIPGVYEIYIRMNDIHGNISEEPIAQIRVSFPIQILAADTHQTIANARLFLYGYNHSSKSFESISDLISSAHNPSFTDLNGSFAIALPEGDYKIDISALGYQNTTVSFTLGDQLHQSFPTVFLQKETIGPGVLINYLLIDIGDNTTLLTHATKQLFISYRFAEVIGILIVLFFILMTFFVFLVRTRLSIKKLRTFIHFHFHNIFNTNLYIHGTVVDKRERPLSEVVILITDRKTQEIITKTMTDSSGTFYFKYFPEGDYIITACKEGFLMESTALLEEKPLLLLLHTNGESKVINKGRILHVVFDCIGNLFETLLILCFLIEFLLFQQFGFRVSIFFLLSLANLSLWILFIRQYSLKKRIA